MSILFLAEYNCHLVEYNCHREEKVHCYPYRGPVFVPRSPCPPRQIVRLHDLHAYILRHADKTNIEVAEIVRCHPRFVFNVHKAFVTQGLGAALHRKLCDEPPTPWKQDGAGEARLIQPAANRRKVDSAGHRNYSPIVS